MILMELMLQIYLIHLEWSANCVIIYTDIADQAPTFTIIETNLYVPVVTFSTQDNSKLLPQLKNNKLEQISCKTRIISTKFKFKSSNGATFSRCK